MIVIKQDKGCRVVTYFDEKEYEKIQGSRPGLFYGTAKVHKLGKGEDLNELTTRPLFQI